MAQPPPPAAAGSRGLLFVLLALLVLAIGSVGMVLVVVVLSARIPGPPPPVAANPPPAPPPVIRPAPSPEPAEQPPVMVDFVSAPAGASVYENDQLVCVAPCQVPHPPHAPLPRTFVFRLDGYKDHPVEMVEAVGPISATLVRLRSVGPAPTSATPRPTIGRDR